MLDARYVLLRVLREHRVGSYETQAARRDTVSAFVKTLDANGFSQAVRKADYRIKESHVRRCVGVWREAGVSTRSIENRLSHLRSMAAWQGRPGILRSNDQYLPGRDRGRTAKASKAGPADEVDWRRARSPYARASIRLQKAFGLRRKEALLVQPGRSPADCSMLVLHGECTKGGRYREIPAYTAEQREAIAYAKSVAGGGSLVPPVRSYISWRHEYRREAERCGLPNGSTHCLRHAWAQARYEALSGMAAPVAGGPWRGDMDADQRRADGQGRDGVSKELGHGRRAVTAAYIGGAKAA